MSNVELWRWRRVYRARRMRNSWSPWVCSTQSRGGWGEALWQPTDPHREWADCAEFCPLVSDRIEPLRKENIKKFYLKTTSAVQKCFGLTDKKPHWIWWDYGCVSSASSSCYWPSLLVITLRFLKRQMKGEYYKLIVPDKFSMLFALATHAQD